MTGTISRRRVLSTIAALPAASLLVGWSDSANAQQSVSPPASSGDVDMAKLLEPGVLEDKVEGAEDAPVTVVEYASMTCGHCANFHKNTYPALKEKYIDTGKVRFIMREFPFDPRAEAAFMLARCSDGKYFAMIDVLFKQQDNWARAQDASGALLQIAKLGGFTQESFTACLTNQELLDDVRSVRNRAAEEFGVDATPTFFIDGKKYSGAMSIEEMSAIIDPLL
ncbi:DsbA family protein [Nitratireductor luteus]|uniref:DsbA family protein n=1 Tax=Nitratireductor luteus TaxID=2976980 RepID=UPI00223F34F1|nr:DsbA family protein [Nitratireductor luteus]